MNYLFVYLPFTSQCIPVIGAQTTAYVMSAQTVGTPWGAACEMFPDTGTHNKYVQPDFDQAAVDIDTD